MRKDCDHVVGSAEGRGRNNFNQKDQGAACEWSYYINNASVKESVHVLIIVWLTLTVTVWKWEKLVVPTP